jgi:hypothetical protein
MKKNILAENMRRFGTKNLSEQEQQRYSNSPIPSGRSNYTREKLTNDIQTQRAELQAIKDELSQKIMDTRKLDKYLNGGLIARIRTKLDILHQKDLLKQDQREVEILKRKLQHAQDALEQHQSGNIINKKNFAQRLITLLKTFINELDDANDLV